MDIDVKVVVSALSFAALMCGTMVKIYSSQERANGAQNEVNKNIEKRLADVEEESDGHREKINDILREMDRKIGKIYTIVEGLKK